MPKPTEEMDEYIRENLRYDPETGHLWWIKLSENKSGMRNVDKPIGYSSKNYLRATIYFEGLNRGYYLHRLAWFLHYGVWPDMQLDHINGVKDDNKIENLRPATSKENNRNRRSVKSSSSKYKGVGWSKEKQKWKSYIKHNQVSKHLGYSTSEEEAARAYDKAARELFGDYARLNFPDEHEQGALHGHDV